MDGAKGTIGTSLTPTGASSPGTTPPKVQSRFGPRGIKRINQQPATPSAQGATSPLSSSTQTASTTGTVFVRASPSAKPIPDQTPTIKGHPDLFSTTSKAEVDAFGKYADWMNCSRPIPTEKDVSELGRAMVTIGTQLVFNEATTQQKTVSREEEAPSQPLMKPPPRASMGRVYFGAEKKAPIQPDSKPAPINKTSTPTESTLTTPKSEKGKWHISIPLLTRLTSKAFYPDSGKTRDGRFRAQAKGFLKNSKSLQDIAGKVVPIDPQRIEDKEYMEGNTDLQKSVINRLNDQLKAKFPGKNFEDLTTKQKFELVTSYLDQNNKDYVALFGGTELPITVDRGDGDNHQIKCRYYESTCDPTNPDPDITTKVDKSKPTMVVFHGNGGTGDDMCQTANYYKELGWNVVTVTMGGYPGSDEGLRTTEATTIQDTKAVLDHLKKEHGVTTIGVHGYSIGGSLAINATRLSPDVKLVVADRTFTTARNVGGNLVRNLFGIVSKKVAPEGATKSVVGTVFPKGKSVPGVSEGIKTNGLNNIESVENFNGHFVSVGGTNDFLMQKHGKGDETNFATELQGAHKPRDSSTISKSFLTDQEHHDPDFTDLSNVAEVTVNIRDKIQGALLDLAIKDESSK